MAGLAHGLASRACACQVCGGRPPNAGQQHKPEIQQSEVIMNMSNANTWKWFLNRWGGSDEKRWKSWNGKVKARRRVVSESLMRGVKKSPDMNASATSLTKLGNKGTLPNKLSLKWRLWVLWENTPVSTALRTLSKAFNKRPFHSKSRVDCFSQNRKITFYLKWFKVDGAQVPFIYLFNIYSETVLLDMQH